MKPQFIASIVYFSAFAPLLILIVLSYRKLLPPWIWKVYIASFLICAIGWEVWFTYGLIDGQSVNIRRPAELNALLPQNINWILNSLADAGIVLNGIFYVWIFSSDKKKLFTAWSWKEFIILTIFFLLQNVIVEMYIYHAQLAAGYQLSWAPMAFLGTWFNPELFNWNGRSVHLQAQLPWLIMTPLVYWYIRKFKLQFNPNNIA